MLVLLSGTLRGQSPQPDVVAVLKGHTDTIEALALSPDGSLIATASFDKTIKLFDLASSRLVRSYGGEQGHKGQVLAVAFTPKRDQIATGGADNFARIWDVPVKAPLKSVALAAAATRAVVAADGKTVAVASADGTVKILPQGEEKGALELKGHTGAVNFLVASGPNWVTVGADKTIRLWSADGKPIGRYSLTSDFTGLAVGQSIYSASGDGILRQWQLPIQPTRAFPPLKDAVTAFASSSDGNTILTATADKLLTLGSVSNNQATGSFAGAKSAIQTAALAPDNTTIVAGCSDGSVILWDRQGKVKGQVSAHANGVAALQFHPAQPILYSAGADGMVKGWALPLDPKQPREKAVKQSIKAHAGAVTALVINPANGHLITAGSDKLLRVWEPAKPEKALREIGPLPSPITALALSRDGQLLGGSLGKEMRIWNTADGKEVGKLAQSADVLALSFTADKLRLLIGRADNRAMLVEVKDGTEVQSFSHGGAVRGVLAHPGSSTVITASADKTIVISPIGVQRSIPLGGKANGVVISPDNQRLIAIGPGKSCTSYLAGNGQKEREFATSGEATGSTVSKDGQRLAVAGADGTINLYTMGDGKLIGSFPTGGPVSDLAFAPTQPQLAGIRKNEVVAWNVAFQNGQPLPAEFGRTIQTFPHPREVASPAFNAAGELYTAGADNVLRCFHIASDAPVKNLQHPNIVNCVAFDDTGNRLATGCNDGILRIWDVAKGTPLKTINAHVQTMPQNIQNPIYAVLWTPDHKQIFTASYDKTIKLWDAAAGTLVREFRAGPDPVPIAAKNSDKKEPPKVDPKLAAEFLGGLVRSDPPLPPGPPGHRDQVFSLALSKDGKYLASGSSDRTVKLWDVAAARVVREFVNPDLKRGLPGETPPSHPGWVQAVRVTPDGQFIVSAGPAPRGKSYLAVWKFADGQRVFGAELDFGPIHSLAITPDGARLILGCAPVRGKPDADVLVVKLPSR